MSSGIAGLVTSLAQLESCVHSGVKLYWTDDAAIELLTLAASIDTSEDTEVTILSVKQSTIVVGYEVPILFRNTKTGMTGTNFLLLDKDAKDALTGKLFLRYDRRDSPIQKKAPPKAVNPLYCSCNGPCEKRFTGLSGGGVHFFYCLACRKERIPSLS